MIKTFCRNPLLIPELNQPMEECRFRTYILDDRSLSVLLRIEQMLQSISPMGSDECRFLYIEAIKGTFQQWLEIIGETADNIDELHENWTRQLPDEKEWFEIGVARFEQQVRLYVANIYDETYVLANTRNIYTPREHDDTPRYDAYELLCKIEQYLLSIIDIIRENPNTYMDYIEKYYPYEKRKGTISMSDWCRIMERKLVELDDEELMILKKVTGQTLPYYDGPMTLREYMKAWKVAYCGIYGSESIRNGSPEEVFTRSAKGQEEDVNKYDPDSEKDFIQWGKENVSYHCFDVSYMNVHLYPAPKAGKWRPHLIAVHEWAIDNLLAAAKALSDEGIAFAIPQARDILRMHKMSGEIIIDPDYADRSRIGEVVRRLPEVGYDGVTQEQVNELIKATRWEKLKEVKLKTNSK